MVALLVPDKKLDRFGQRQIFSSVYHNNLAYHPGPVLPHGGDGSPLVKLPKCPYSKNVPHGQKCLWQDVKGLNGTAPKKLIALEHGGENKKLIMKQRYSKVPKMHFDTNLHRMHKTWEIIK